MTSDFYKGSPVSTGIAGSPRLRQQVEMKDENRPLIPDRVTFNEAGGTPAVPVFGLSLH